jgi:Mg/Co/Ni transporter MgtE
MPPTEQHRIVSAVHATSIVRFFNSMTPQAITPLIDGNNVEHSLSHSKLALVMAEFNPPSAASTLALVLPKQAAQILIKMPDKARFLILQVLDGDRRGKYLRAMALLNNGGRGMAISGKDLAMLESASAAGILNDMNAGEAAIMLEDMSIAAAADLMGSMNSKAAAEAMAEMSTKKVTAILAALSTENAAAIVGGVNTDCST